MANQTSKVALPVRAGLWIFSHERDSMSKRAMFGGTLITILMVLSMLGAVPAGANHKPGHDNGKDKASSSSDSPGNSDKKNKEPDPDPTPTKTDPATRGDTDCGDYGNEEGGPYDHDNCDGTQGSHGNGGNGKCAGCTGKADDKSPGGQYPGDHNNGYECDHNGGVGKGNPAHSKCPAPGKTSTPSPSPSPSKTPGRHHNSNPHSTPTPSPSPSSSNVPPPPVVNPGGIKVCDKDNDMSNGIQKCDKVLGIRFNASPGLPPEQPVASPAAVLPFTGFRIGLFLVLGVALMVAGAFLVRSRERGRAN
jgi:hypothetical protein